MSLTYEINYDRTVGYGDNEMVAAVLKATSPNLCLSNVLETMAGFTLDTLLKFSQGYFEKQNALDMCNQLTSKVKLSDEVACYFVIRFWKCAQKS